MDKLAYGRGAEEMHRQHPRLSLSKIHAAMSYCYDHQGELDAAIERLAREYGALKAKTEDSPPRRRLRAMGKLA